MENQMMIGKLSIPYLINLCQLEQPIQIHFSKIKSTSNY